MSTKTKENKQFMILSALAIIFVVDAHAWSPLAVFTNFFPYNSFFMPLFVFVSGYFFSERNLEKPFRFLLHKAQKLLLPYYAILFLVLLAMEVGRKIAPIGPKYGELVSLKEFLINPFYKADLSSLLTPGWFVPALFCVLLAWIIIRWGLNKIWNEYVATIAYCVLGTICVYLSRKGWNETAWLPLLRTGFLIQFYQMGVLYRCKLEEGFRKIPALAIWIVTIVINSFLIYMTGNQIYFNDINKMTGFMTDIYVLPLMTSVTGIAFWLAISDKLVPVLGENKLINYISNHTYAIMMFHIIWFNVYNFLISRIPQVAKTFDFEKFYKTAWYRYEPATQFRFFYVMAGLFGALLMCWIVDKIRRKAWKQ
ncbi:MAG: acyltransferase [Lachnospiraceae bacterium]|nr:acyltransferase [Lachnospiraceae bacterium]